MKPCEQSVQITAKKGTLFVLDPIEERILFKLQDNCRISFQDLGNAVGLSSSSCHKRVKSLETSGIIESYSANLNATKMGLNTNAYIRVFLRDQTQETMRAFELALREHDQIMECALMTGEYDYLLRVLCVDLAAFERFQSEVISKLPGVARVQSNIPLRMVMSRSSAPLKSLIGPIY